MQWRLYRDMQTAMPKDGAEDHDAESVALSDIAHEKICDPRVAAWLDEAEAAKDSLSKEERADLRAMRRQWLSQAALPDDLASALKQAENEGERLHTEARPKGDWEKVLPFFKRQLDLVKKAAAIKQERLGAASAYDALLDAYCTGWTSEAFDALFDDLEPFLKKMLRDVTEKQAARPAPLALEGPFQAALEEKLSREVAEKIGVDFDRAVLYFIPDHPSGGGTPGDVRISGRPDENNFMAPLYDLIHETGHGLYDQNVPQAWKFRPVGQAMPMDVHEGQALIWEFVVGKSKEFSSWLSTRARDIFGRENDPALSAENLFARNTHVTPSLERISIETSEVTYLLHIIMRYRLEKALVEGTLAPEDLPEAWNKMSEDMFGRRPENNTEGVLQDVQWFSGSFGYFPSYALGYLGAVQLFDAAVRADPSIPSEMEKGNFAPLKEWLGENIHGKGRLLSAKELYRAATGADLSAAPLKRHLANRYLGGDETPSIRPHAGKYGSQNSPSP